MTGFSTFRRSVGWRLAIGCGAAAFTLGALTTSALGFGTVNTLGQKAEHEMVTRTLECNADRALTDCFQTGSMALLAGEPGTLGGVGEADRPPFLFGHSENHCDDADYNVISPSSPYRQTQAQAHAQLNKCIEQFRVYMKNAVDLAGGLVNDGQLLDDFIPSDGCKFPQPDQGLTDVNAKCSVINQLGRALHIAQDFWSHSNWGDDRDTSKPASLANPPGLARTDLPSFFDYPPKSYVVPTGLVTGCDDSVFINSCGKAGTFIGHGAVNKDKGNIDPRTGVATGSTSDRGKIGNNFQLAVTGARTQTRSVWSQFVGALATTYGQDKSGLMVRGLTHDTPWGDCPISGESERAKEPPNPNATGSREVGVSIVNRTTAPLVCRSITLDQGEWKTLPPATIARGGSGAFRPVSFGLGVVGKVSYAVQGRAVKINITWSVPPFFSNSFSCTPSGVGAERYSCTTSGSQGGNKPTPTFEVKGP